MQFDNLQGLYVQQLKDLYSAETQLVEALPKMAEAASHADLKAAFEKHWGQTKTHVERLDKIFAELGESGAGHTCQAMQGLVKEGEEVIEGQGHSSVKDAALIAAAQRVEHYEIAGYGTVRTYAKDLGKAEQAKLLQTTLDEEGATDKALTGLAEGGMFRDGINEEAE